MVARIIEIIVYRLPIYIFNSYIDNTIREYITRKVINPRSKVIQTVYYILHYLVQCLK